MSTDEDYCGYSDLRHGECAHCAGIAPFEIVPELRMAGHQGRRGRRVWPPTKAEKGREACEDSISRTKTVTAAPGANGHVNGSQIECRCGKPTRDVHTVCDDCGDMLTRALSEVPWMDDELDTTITRQRAIPTESGSPSASCSCKDDEIDRCPHGGLPWHEKAADARRALHGLLSTWCRFCEEENVRHQSPMDGLPREDTLPAMSRWLLWRVDGLTLHDIGPEAVDEITDAVAECNRLIDRRPDRWYAGPCNAEDEEGVECGADLYAKRTKGLVECRDCGASYDVAARRTWLLAAAEDRLADAATIARSVSWLGAEPLTASRVRKWAERGRIVAKGHDGSSPLYRIGDAINLLASDTSMVS